MAAQVLNAPLEFRLGEGVFRVAVDLCNKAMPKHDVTTRLPYLLKDQSALSRPFALTCSRALECAEGINGTSQTSALTGSPETSA